LIKQKEKTLLIPTLDYRDCAGEKYHKMARSLDESIMQTGRLARFSQAPDFL